MKRYRFSLALKWLANRCARICGWLVCIGFWRMGSRRQRRIRVNIASPPRPTNRSWPRYVVQPTATDAPRGPAPQGLSPQAHLRLVHRNGFPPLVEATACANRQLQRAVFEATAAGSVAGLEQWLLLQGLEPEAVAGVLKAVQRQIAAARQHS